MASSSLAAERVSDTLFCPIRKIWVTALPEEKIRQSLIHKMIHNLGYPQESIVLEKNLNQLPHLQKGGSLPNRRTDLIVLAKNLHPEHPFYPLLLVECKAVPLTQKVLRQMIGYNQFVKSFFIAAVNQTIACTGHYDPVQKDFCFQEGLLSYNSLLVIASNENSSNNSNASI